MEHKDEHALESVEGGKEISHDNRLLVDEEEAKCPGEAQEKEESDSPECPRPVGGDTGELKVNISNGKVLTGIKLISHFLAALSLKNSVQFQYKGSQCHKKMLSTIANMGWSMASAANNVSEYIMDVHVNGGTHWWKKVFLLLSFVA